MGSLLHCIFSQPAKQTYCPLPFAQEGSAVMLPFEALLYFWPGVGWRGYGLEGETVRAEAFEGCFVY